MIPDPVGPGATKPIDAHLQFDELPDVPMRLVVDTDVRVGPGGVATPVGSAQQFVESLTGRLATFPPDDVVLDAASHRSARSGVPPSLTATHAPTSRHVSRTDH